MVNSDFKRVGFVFLSVYVAGTHNYWSSVEHKVCVIAQIALGVFRGSQSGRAGRTGMLLWVY